MPVRLLLQSASLPSKDKSNSPNMEKGLKDEGLDLSTLQDPGDRYELGEILGTGVTANVYKAIDKEVGGKQVAIKIQKIKPEYMTDIEEEYKILRDLSSHPNLPDFYGAYKKSDDDGEKIWFVMQLCEGGPVTDLVRALNRDARKMNELHIAFILREVLKALVALHENHIIHRDVKASNVLLTRDGEVKLVDFGLSRELSSTMGKRQTCLGSPCWMAPEVVTSKTSKGSYDNRADVWALGITAIELGDGKAPFQDMHPTRALFQIVRNPPPTLYRPANWSQDYNDFISECLTKNPEHRPYMSELIQHPFFSELPENDHHLNAELRSLLEAVTSDVKSERKPEIRVKTGLLQMKSVDPEPMDVEDLAAIESISEEAIMQQLEARYRKGQFYTYVGEILMFLNPNKPLSIYGFQNYNKYKFKSRSDNEPHIFGVADSAYQDMLHHNTVQSIVISGETMSGKTTQARHIIRHLTHLGMSSSKVSERVLKGVDLLHAFANAATPENPDSTRHASVTQVTFSSSGKLSGAIFWILQLEKFRVTGNRSPYHANFHIFYYFYDGLKDAAELEKYNLDGEKSYCYLRRNILEGDKDAKAPPGPREDPEGNVVMFKRMCSLFEDLGFTEEEIENVWRTMAAIILLGEIEYKDDDDKNADISNTEVVDSISTLLCVDSKKLAWALCNYCVIEQDTAARRRHSKPEALLARNVFAQSLYSRLVDWIVNNINCKLSLSRAVYGDSHCVNVVDIFGIECYPDNNNLEQLFVNAMNEQIQFFYNQKIFISAMEDEEEEEVASKKLQFYNNRETIDELMNKPHGVFHILEEANKLHQDGEFVTAQIKLRKEGSRVKSVNDEQFSVAHYTGKMIYETDTICSKNRDFLPPELTEVMRTSSDPVLKQLFTNKLSRTGNVTMIVEAAKAVASATPGKKKWGALLMDSRSNIRRYNTVSKGEFSQTRGIRTAAATFRATCLELLRMLSQGTTHFVRCLRTDLTRTSDGFQSNIVKQQLRALAVTDTARARKIGFSHRIPFDKFLDSYQFLAFDFDENVEKTKDNCRLLMIRLKMEGWMMGNTKVFLKYYNEEFLSRLYETQVKKIVKVQSMLRSFLARRNVEKKKTLSREHSLQTAEIPKISLNQEQAATVIQRHIKGYCVRRKYGPLITTTGKLNNATAMFIREYFKRWKTKSIFQVLLLYRAQKHQDLIYFSQQVHLYSQTVVSAMNLLIEEKVDLENVDSEVDSEDFIGKQEMAVWKLPFRIKEMPFMDSSDLCHSVYERMEIGDDMQWDEPFKILHKGCQTALDKSGIGYQTLKKQQRRFHNFVDTPFNRDPEVASRAYSRQSYTDEFDEEEYARAFGGPSRRGSPNMRRSPTNNQRLSPVPPPTPKKKPIGKIPPPPLNRRLRAEDEEESNNNNNQELSEFRKKLRPTKNLQKFDPVIELEKKGKQMHNINSENEDDPPFNFQAMLRKTDNKFSVHKGKPNENSDSANNNKKDLAPNNINERMPLSADKKKCFIRKDSFENLKRMVATSKDFARDGCKASVIRENGELDNLRNELLPGFVVIGKVTDL